MSVIDCNRANSTTVCHTSSTPPNQELFCNLETSKCVSQCPESTSNLGIQLYGYEQERICVERCPTANNSNNHVYASDSTKKCTAQCDSETFSYSYIDPTFAEQVRKCVYKCPSDSPLVDQSARTCIGLSEQVEQNRQSEGDSLVLWAAVGTALAILLVGFLTFVIYWYCCRKKLTRGEQWWSNVKMDESDDGTWVKGLRNKANGGRKAPAADNYFGVNDIQYSLP